MSIGEIVGELFGGVLRAVGCFVVDVVLEIAIRGPGTLICCSFKKNIDPDGGWVVVLGAVFWLSVAIAGYLAYSYVYEALAIDKCLDSGGAYDYPTKECVRR